MTGRSWPPVVVPCDHDEPEGFIPGQEGGQELPLAAPPQYLYRIGKAAVPPLADIRHLLQDDIVYTLCAPSLAEYVLYFCTAAYCSPGGMGVSFPVES